MVRRIKAYCYRQSVWSVGLSVSLLVGLAVTCVSPAQMAELIQMLVGMWTWVGARKHY